MRDFLRRRQTTRSTHTSNHKINTILIEYASLIRKSLIFHINRGIEVLFKTFEMQKNKKQQIKANNNHPNNRNLTFASFRSSIPASSGYSTRATTSRIPALIIIFAQFTQGVNVVYIVAPFVLIPCTAA